MAIILDGKSLSEKIINNLKAEISTNNLTPSLAVVIVGNNPASRIYVKRKHEVAKSIGIKSFVVELPEHTKQNELELKINELNQNENIDAILVQLPLPSHINQQKIIEMIRPDKDVDGFHPYNLGNLLCGYDSIAKPCTPFGIIKLLEHYNINCEGKNVVIVGRSTIVGKPLAAMFTNLNATVTLCHSKTKELQKLTKAADIFVSAIGKPNFFNAEYIKDDAVVIDVGINRKVDGKLTGDVDFENVKDKVSYITPVPKGVGPMTIAMLMYNTIQLYKNHRN